MDSKRTTSLQLNAKLLRWSVSLAEFLVYKSSGARVRLIASRPALRVQFSSIVGSWNSLVHSNWSILHLASSPDPPALLKLRHHGALQNVLLLCFLLLRVVNKSIFRQFSPDVFQITLHWSPYKVFLQFLYLWRVLIKNPDDATLAPLSILSNMQIKAAITEIPFFWP